MYVFKFEPEMALLTVTRTGLWSTETVLAYEILIREQLANLGRCGPSTSFIIDIRSQGAQPQEVADALRAMVGRLGSLNAARTAVVSASGIAKLQARRIADQSTQVFTSMARARDWVMGNLGPDNSIGPVYDEPSEAEAEGSTVHLLGPSSVDVNLTPAAALETSKRIGNAAVEALLAITKSPSPSPSRVK